MRIVINLEGCLIPANDPKAVLMKGARCCMCIGDVLLFRREAIKKEKTIIKTIFKLKWIS